MNTETEIKRQTGIPSSALLKKGSMNWNKSTSKRWIKGQPFWPFAVSIFGMKLRWLTNSSQAKLENHFNQISDASVKLKQY